MKNIFPSLLFVLIIFLPGLLYSQEGAAGSSGFQDIYFSQKYPGEIPELFAPDIIVSEVHSSPTMSPDGKEMIIDFMGEDCKYYVMKDHSWTPQPALPFQLPGVCNGGFISPSGKMMILFIWKDNIGNVFYRSHKRQGYWSELEPLGEAVNSYKASWQFSTAKNENLYFSSDGILMVSVYDGNKYLEPARLKLESNEDLKGVTPFIAPDESYLLFSEGYKIEGADLHISYRLRNNTWTKPLNLGPTVNIENNMDLCPKVSPDGKFMFFISRRPGPDYGLYWVDARFIEKWKPQELK